MGRKPSPIFRLIEEQIHFQSSLRAYHFSQMQMKSMAIVLTLLIGLGLLFIATFVNTTTSQIKLQSAHKRFATDTETASKGVAKLPYELAPHPDAHELHLQLALNASYIKPQSDYKRLPDTTRNDGCGMVDNRDTSIWVPMTEEESEDVTKLQQCLTRTVPRGGWQGNEGYDLIHPRAFQGKLNCTRDVSFETVQSTLSRYNLIWLHGDSIMAQNFYTLACILNSSIATWNGTRIQEKVFATGLGLSTQEQFEYKHALGTTKVVYSRFGERWGMDANLYSGDFPFAIRTLTSRDTIVTNGASCHYHLPLHPHHNTNLSSIVDYIIGQSTLTNATFYLFEPTPEEWQSPNGNHYPNLKKCRCHALTDAPHWK